MNLSVLGCWRKSRTLDTCGPLGPVLSFDMGPVRLILRAAEIRDRSYSSLEFTATSDRGAILRLQPSIHLASVLGGTSTGLRGSRRIPGRDVRSTSAIARLAWSGGYHQKGGGHSTASAASLKVLTMFSASSLTIPPQQQRTDIDCSAASVLGRVALFAGDGVVLTQGDQWFISAISMITALTQIPIACGVEAAPLVTRAICPWFSDASSATLTTTLLASDHPITLIRASQAPGLFTWSKPDARIPSIPQHLVLGFRVTKY